MTHTRTLSTLSTRSECSQTELTLWRQALDHFDNGEYRDSLAAFAMLEPRAKVLYNMAMCAESNGDRTEAIDFLKRSVECDPYLAIASFQLGCYYVEAGDGSGAVEAFEQAIKV